MNYVYIHTTPNNKKYIGITTQKPERRGRNGKGYVNNTHFSRAILKYGWDNIVHQVFEVDSDEEMYYLEKYLISFYETTNPAKGYNHSTGGEKPCSGVKWNYSEEQRDAKRGSNNPMYGKTHSKDAREKMSNAQKKERPVQAFSGDTLIGTGNSISEAARETNLKKSNIGACINGKHRMKSYGGYIGSYKTI